MVAPPVFPGGPQGLSRNLTPFNVYNPETNGSLQARIRVFQKVLSAKHLQIQITTKYEYLAVALSSPLALFLLQY
jgi:hypothetical protein